MKNSDKLTPHFTLGEFTSSAMAAQLRSENMPNELELKRLTETSIKMEIIRVLLGGKPITITSGYRNEKVNRAVGGAVNSDHRLGLAVDFRRHGYSSFKICQIIAKSALQYDQLIDYQNGRVHIGFNSRNRKQNMIKTGGGYKHSNFS